MSHYTTEVRYICETYAEYTESQGYKKVDEIIQKARPKIFEFYYPIFDEAYRAVLETKILRHYYTREIGAETVGRWKLFLQQTMNEIMPYYNKLYESELIKFDPMRDVDIYTEHEKKGEGNTSTNTKADINEDKWRYYHDTPQGGITGLKSLRYLTEAEHNENNQNANSDTAGNYTDLESYLQHVYGKGRGVSFSKLLKEYRDTFLNIDMMIIDDLKDLFMLIW